MWSWNFRLKKRLGAQHFVGCSSRSVKDKIPREMQKMEAWIVTFQRKQRLQQGHLYGLLD